ncbi:MAG: hypothetical protein HOD62_09965 [Chloroflexi bacterium]|nr:hypothetical protein [Chloroflexota bacterium]
MTSAAALKAIDDAVTLLANAERQVIVAGGGVTLATAEPDLLELPERTGVHNN